MRPFPSAVIAGLALALLGLPDTGRSDVAPALRDAAGREVGHVVRVLAGGDRALALVELAGGTGDLLSRADFEAGESEPAVGFVEVFASASGLVHPYAPYVLFDGAGCSGNPRLSAAATRPAADARAALVGERMALYLASAGTSQAVPVASLLDGAGCHVFRYRVDSLPARLVGELSRDMILPLHWN